MQCEMFTQKWKKNKNKKKTDMDWAFYIKMDQAQYLRKDPKKAKQITFRKFKEDPAFQNKISQRPLIALQIFMLFMSWPSAFLV